MEGACEDNLLRQQEEIEALNSIYEEFIVLGQYYYLQYIYL